jgi:quinol monooxygenase YgiN
MIVLDRRNVLAVLAIAGTAPSCVSCGAIIGKTEEPATMYGLIGQLVAAPGRREELASILLGGSSALPGCLSYVVALDAKEADAIWVSEVWESEERHKASLSLPAVRDAIARGRPLIARFGTYSATRPLGGVGLPVGVS